MNDFYRYVVTQFFAAERELQGEEADWSAVSMASDHKHREYGDSKKAFNNALVNATSCFLGTNLYRHLRDLDRYSREWACFYQGPPFSIPHHVTYQSYREQRIIDKVFWSDVLWSDMLDEGNPFFRRRWLVDNTLIDWVAEEYDRRGIHRVKAHLLQLTAHATENGKVSWWERYEDIGYPKRLKTASAGKYLKKVRRAMQWEDVSDDSIQRVAEAMGQELRGPKYSHEIVSGPHISETYDDAYFGSCMHENTATRFYNEQDNVEIIRIIDEDGRLRGRALLWTLDSGHKFMDRVYPSDGGKHIKYITKVAEKNGWAYKTVHSIGGSVHVPEGVGPLEVTVKDVGHYPFMDTLMCSGAPDSLGKVTLSREYGDYIWDYTDDVCPWVDAERYRCDCCEDLMSEDAALYTAYDYFICHYCASDHYVHTDDGYMRHEDVVFCANIDEYVDREHRYVHETVEGDYIYTNRWRSPEPYVMITAGNFDGEYAHEDNVAEVDGEIWYTDDKDYPGRDERVEVYENMLRTQTPIL